MATKSDFKGAVASGADRHFSANDTPTDTATPTVEESVIKTTTEPPTNTLEPEKGKYSELFETFKQKPDELPGRNISFYLENSVVNAILTRAKELNVSRSKLVGQLLKQVLLQEE